MRNLTTAHGIQAYLKDTRFAASDVQLLSGGRSAFTYRIVLETPLPTGEKTIILKHFEGYFSDYGSEKIDVQRAEFEHRILSALATSGLFDSNSTVQTPRPIEYDPSTQTIFMTDLGPLLTLTIMLQGSPGCVYEDPNARHQLNGARTLATNIASALGDFLGRFHNWTAAPEQAELRDYCSQNFAAINDYFPVHLDTMARQAKRFGMNEAWVEELVASERKWGSLGGEVLAMGDFWLDNILISPPSEKNDLRIYIIDWEMVRPAPPEFDMGEFTGTAISFARRKLQPRGDYSFVPALQQAYHQHRTLDPKRIATAVGINVMGYGTIFRGSENESEEFLREIAITGLNLIRLARDGEEKEIKEKSLVKDLFSPVPQRDVNSQMVYGI